LKTKAPKEINKAAAAAGRWLPYVEMFSRAHALGRQITASVNQGQSLEPRSARQQAP